MEIRKIKKDKNNLYLIELSNGTEFKIYEDIIIKYQIFQNKVIPENEFEKIQNDNNLLKTYYETLKIISRKLKSELELRKELKLKKYPKTSIDYAIAKLRKEGYLNNKLYIESYINDKFKFNNFGPNKLKNNLIKLGFKESEILPYLNINYHDKIKYLIDKKVKLNKKLSNNLLKLNICDYLITLGYPKELFIDYINDININENILIANDYKKIYEKYKNKYDSYQLKLFIKNKLFQKGYSSELISEVLENDLL